MTSAAPIAPRLRNGLRVGLLIGLLGACGGEEEPETPEVSVKDAYCAAYREFFDKRASHGPDVSEQEVLATLKAWGRDLKEIGIPEDMPADAQAGHDIWVRLIGEVGDDAGQADVLALEQGLTKEELTQVQAFSAYNDQTCLSVSSASPE